MPAAAAMKRAEARCPHRVRGLTLVELLVVFVLLALVSTLLFQGLGFFAAKYDTVQRWRAQGTDATLQQNWFVSTIRGLAPYGREVRRFRAMPASFAGITLQPLAGEPGMPLTARWSIEAGEGAEAIVYEEASMSGVRQRPVDDTDPRRNRPSVPVRGFTRTLARPLAHRRGVYRLAAEQHPVDHGHRPDILAGPRGRIRLAPGHGPGVALNAVPPPPRGAPGGFVLVATLLVLAVLAALGAFIDRMVETDVERARLARQSLQDELNRHATEATLLYLISTNRKNHRGMLLENEQQFLESMDDAPLPESGDGELTMASAAYQGLGRMRFAMQDEWGLVPVNVPDSLMLESLLGHVGVSSAGIARLVPRIEDYIDLDDRIGLNGAERIDYRQRGMPPPANWFMVSHLELKNVLGADRIISPVQWRGNGPRTHRTGCRDAQLQHDASRSAGVVSGAG